MKRTSYILMGFIVFASLQLLASHAYASKTPLILQPPIIKSPLKTKSRRLEANVIQKVSKSRPVFDLPVTYNSKVHKWIQFFQTRGKRSFTKWLNRSHRYIPKIQPALQAKGLPNDLVYLAMIESGFSAKAVSSAKAVGYWQFIKPTANRYGLTTDWWIDERRDFIKSTIAAAAYLNDLYRMFDSWYLAASAYNMGEGRTKRLIKRHGTRNFWKLSQLPGFPKETRNYVPKIIAAMLIAKSPEKYGFNNIQPQRPYDFEYFFVPGGTDLENLAYYIGSDKKLLKQLNPELLKGFVPQYITTHRIRIPKGHTLKASKFIRASL